MRLFNMLFFVSDTLNYEEPAGKKEFKKKYRFDVKLAFLNGDLQKEIYITQPEGFKMEGDETKVYKLKKVLYGWKKAPRALYSKVDIYFQKNVFIRSEN